MALSLADIDVILRSAESGNLHMRHRRRSCVVDTGRQVDLNAMRMRRLGVGVGSCEAIMEAVFQLRISHVLLIPALEMLHGSTGGRSKGFDCFERERVCRRFVGWK